MKIIFFVTVLLSSIARAEGDAVYNWISQLSQIPFNQQTGSAGIPTGVLQTVSNGTESPVMQFILVNHIIDEGTRSAINDYPRRRDPYVVAKAKFNHGLCLVQQTFQQALLVSLLPQLSSAEGSVDSSVSQQAQQLMLALVAGMQQTPGCDGQPGSGLPANLVGLISGSSSGH